MTDDALRTRCAVLETENESLKERLEWATKKAADPFQPDWNLHHFDWHAYDADGEGTFFSECPCVAWDNDWWGVPDMEGNTGQAYQSFADHIDIVAHPDWRNSLRHRPEPQP